MTPIDPIDRFYDIYKQTGLRTYIGVNTEGRCHLGVCVSGGYLDIFRIYLEVYRIWGEDHRAQAVQVVTNIDRKEAEDTVQVVFKVLGIQTMWRVIEVPTGMTERPSFVLVPVKPVDLSILPPWSPL